MAAQQPPCTSLGCGDGAIPSSASHGTSVRDATCCVDSRRVCLAAFLLKGTRQVKSGGRSRSSLLLLCFAAVGAEPESKAWCPACRSLS